MSCYELVVRFKDIEDPLCFSIPIRSGMLYNELRCILDDFAWLLKDGERNVHHFLTSSLTKGYPYRVLFSQEDKIDKPTEKALDEEVVVVWEKEGKPNSHSVFVVQGFVAFYSFWIPKLCWNTILFKEPPLYVWLLFMVKCNNNDRLEFQSHECDSRSVIIVQEGTSVKQMKALVRTPCDKIRWISENEEIVECLESSTLAVTAVGRRWTCEEMMKRVVARKQCYKLQHISNMFVGVFSIGETAFHQKLYRSQERGRQWFSDTFSDKCESDMDVETSCEER